MFLIWAGVSVASGRQEAYVTRVSVPDVAQVKDSVLSTPLDSTRIQDGAYPNTLDLSLRPRNSRTGRIHPGVVRRADAWSVSHLQYPYTVLDANRGERICRLNRPDELPCAPPLHERRM